MKGSYLTQELSEKSKTKRLDRAVEYVSDYWFPVNPQVLENVKLGLDSGEYELSLSRLISDIKGDISLYSFCLKKLIDLVRQETGAQAPDLNPMELLERASLEQLRTILNVDQHDLSRHAIEVGSPDQIARFRETMLSATTAEALAGTYSIDPEDAYASAVLRQLGHTLIAWNYPGVYSDALSSQSTGQAFDLIITKVLGFSPQMLAMRILNSWGISDDRCQALGILDELNQEQRTITSAVGKTLSRICRVGEALARANDPERYPQAKEDWQLAKTEIERRLGKRGIEIIKERFQDRCESYVTLIPHAFHDGFNFEYDLSEEEEGAQSDDTSVVHRNPFIEKCEPHLARELTELYRRINTEGQSRTHLRSLIKEILPGAGFSSGCIYTVDPTLGLLMPQTEIGRMELRKVKAVDYSIVSSNADMVSLAFQNEDPVLAYMESKFNVPYVALATYFGASERVGVLYLETPNTRADLSQDSLVLNVKALACALNDCL